MIPPLLLRIPTAAFGALLVVAGLLAYHNSFSGPFVFDDLSSIPANPSIRSLGTAWSPPVGASLTVEGRPLLNLTFALNYLSSGTDVGGYHAVNLGIHIFAALVLFGLVHETLRTPRLAPAYGAAARPLAFATALLWLVHPLQTESVTYIVQRAESLMGLCYFTTLYAFARGSTPGARRVWLAASVVACLLGMATKEVMATAPVIVLFYDRTFVAGSFAAAWKRHCTYYCALASTWIVLAWLIFASGGNRSGIIGVGLEVSWLAHWLSQAEALTRYLGLTIWPSPLIFEYGWFRPKPWAEAIPWLLVAGPIVVATLVGLKSRPTLGFIGVWFLVILAPSSAIPSTTQLMVEHRMYVPLAGLVVLIVLGLYRWADRLKSAGHRTFTLTSAVAVALITLTVQRNHDYRTDIALWQDTIAKRPNNALAHLLLGEALENAGQNAAALARYQKARRLRPEFPLAHGNLGRLLQRTGREDEALATLRHALSLQPDFAAAHEAVGVILTQRGQAKEAIAHLQAVARHAPGRATGHFNLAIALAKDGQRQEAIAAYRVAATLQPEDAATHYNLGNLLRDSGRPDLAILSYREALQAQPNHAQAHNNLANLLASAKKFAESVKHYSAALEARPDFVEAHFNLAIALERLGREDDAARHYETILQLNPRFELARSNLKRLRSKSP